MQQRPGLSLIVPTRRRPAPLRRFLDSVARTARHPQSLEIVLVVDADDPQSAAVGHGALALRHVVVPPGRTMGALNVAGYEASVGEYVMLLNDDVVAHTRGWDEAVLRCCRRFPDGIVLVHVNDTLVRHHLCTFPLVSRTFCELAGGVCPREYRRYRIDDHIEDVFNLLAALGERRTVYLPDVVFEHVNAVEHPEAGRVYRPDPDVLALDAPRFDLLFGARKELALRLLDHMEGGTPAAVLAERRRRLAALTDPFALRVPGRQWVERAPWLRRAAACLRRPGEVTALGRRVRRCFAQEGCRGVAGALGRRLGRLLGRAAREASPPPPAGLQ
jgi:glycosyltransferase involved in cell wall biosynthesis